MKTPIHRVTADSKAGRKLAARKSRIEPGVGLTKEQREWNARVEDERAAKKRVLKANEYKCAGCGGVFEFAWTEEEAQAEREKKGWGNVECAIVCDTCYKSMYLPSAK